jgi:hypothetical protein
VKTRFAPFFVILFVMLAAILSRFIGGSDYILAQAIGGYGYGYVYKFSYCPYNKPPYTNPSSPYRFPYTDPTIRFAYPYAYPLPKQYPCPCTIPAFDPLLLESHEQE